MMSDVVADVSATGLDCYMTGDGPEDADLLGCMVNDAGIAFGGMEILALVFGFGILLSLYIASDFDPAPPSIGTILIGSMLIPALPGRFARIGMIIMLLGVIVGIFVLGQRYVLEVGT